MDKIAFLLKTYIRPQRGRVVLLVALLFSGIALDLAAPTQLSRFIDAAEQRRTVHALVTIALVFIGLTLARQVVVAVAGYLSEDVGWRATNALRSDLADHVLRLDLAFHRDHTPGELIERVDGDVEELAEFLSSFVFAMLGRALLCVGILVLVFLTDIRMGALLLAFALVVVLVLRRLQAVAVPRFRALRQVLAQLSGFVEERLAATEDTRANGARGYLMRRLDEHVVSLTRTLRAGMVSSRLFSSVLELSVGIAVGGVLALGAALLPGGSITLGQIFLVYYLTQLLSTSLTVITIHLDGLQKAIGSAERVAELRATSTRVPDGPGATLPAGPLPVVFDRVCFGYSDSRRALDDVSFELPAGRTLGLLGRTGSGKTTVSRLLCRSWDVDSGAVLVGGVDVRRLRLADLRGRIGIVTQEVQLFHATVRDNVTLFDDTVTDDRITAAIADLGLADWYATLPDGLDSVLAGGADTLSAGQAQLLAMTRILLQDPDLVILDEAASRLDPGTERLLEDATARLLASRTGIVIAHRLSTVRRTDRILVLSDGRVEECGDRRALGADPDSRYAALVSGAAE